MKTISWKENYKPLLVAVGLLATLASGSLWAQAQGTVRGRVLDPSNGEGVVGATVVVREVGALAQTDFDGKFELRLPAGTHTVVVQMVGLATIRRQVSVVAGQAITLNLTPEIKSAKTLEVKGRALNNTETSILALQRKAGAVSDGISAESIKQSPDSSAGDVLRRVTGITLIDDRFVFVRGLGERYSTTLLNDALLPSPEPSKRVVPMDLFPAGLIKNIRVVKTFLPENPGEFSGGTVLIETKEYPDEFLLSAGLGLGGNANTTGRHFYSPAVKGGREWLGVDTGRHDRQGALKALPDIFPVSEGFIVPGAFTKLAFNQFQDGWTPRKFNAGPDRSASLSVGDTLGTENWGRFGYVIGSSYKREFRQRDEISKTYVSIPTVNSLFSDAVFNTEQRTVKSRVYSESVLFGNNINLSYEPTSGQQFYSKTLVSYQMGKEVRFSDIHKPFGSADVSFKGQSSSYLFNELFAETFGGKHAFRISKDARPHQLEWHLNHSTATRNEPDRREQLWTRPSDQLAPYERETSKNDGRIYFAEALDTIDSLSIKYTIPFRQWSGLHSKLKVGGLAQDRTKEFESRIYTLQGNRGGNVLGAGGYYPVPGELVYPGLLASNTLDFQEEKDNRFYQAKQKLHAYFGQVDLPLLPKLFFIGGLRYEDSYQFIKTFIPYVEAPGQVSRLFPELDPRRLGVGEIHTKDRLPAANIRWEYAKKNNLRFGYSETLSRPDLRELSDFGFRPYFGADTIFGNANLKRTYIHNYDVRWEWYMAAKEYVGAGVFLKQLSSPIELIGQAGANEADYDYRYENAQSATIKGIELDARKDFLSSWRIEANLFFIESRVEIMPWLERYVIQSGLINTAVDPRARYAPTNLERSLQGQSPYVYNTKLSYFFDKEKNTSLGLFYNLFGDRVALAGTAGASDVIEQGAAVVDLVFEHKLGELAVKVSAKNITDTRFKQTQENPLLGTDDLFRSYRKGVSYSVSGTYRF